jgi:hypothetical protein
VLRHHHVSDELAMVTAASLIEDLQEQVAGVGGAEKRSAPIAAAGNEMQMMLPVAAPKLLRHRTNPKRPHPCLRRGWDTLRR